MTSYTKRSLASSSLKANPDTENSLDQVWRASAIITSAKVILSTVTRAIPSNPRKGAKHLMLLATVLAMCFSAVAGMEAESEKEVIIVSQPAKWTKHTFGDDDGGIEHQKTGVWYHNQNATQEEIEEGEDWTQVKPAEWSDPNMGTFEKICVKEGLVGLTGAAAVGGAGYLVHQAFQNVNVENDAKEVLTCFGEGHTGNVIAWMICFVAAIGAAMIIGAIAHAASGHNSLTFWTSGLSFASVACLMMCFNFMQQDAANAGAAFTKALSFGASEGGNANFAEWGATACVWMSFIFLALMAVTVFFFVTKKNVACWKFARA